MMKYIFLSILLFVASAPILAQDTKEKDKLNREDLLSLGQGAPARAKSFKNIDGDPYYNSDWKLGRLLLKSGAKTEPILLRYKSYTNEVIFKNEGQELVALPTILKGFVFIEKEGNIVFKSGYSSSKNEIQRGDILEVIYEGNVKLLGKHTKKIHEGTTPDFRTGRLTDQFIDVDAYYLIDTKGNWHEVDLKDDDILEALGDHSSEVKTYADSKDFKFKDKNDLNFILAYYDKLHASK